MFLFLSIPSYLIPLLFSPHLFTYPTSSLFLSYSSYLPIHNARWPLRTATGTSVPWLSTTSMTGWRSRPWHSSSKSYSSLSLFFSLSIYLSLPLSEYWSWFHSQIHDPISILLIFTLLFSLSFIHYNSFPFLSGMYQVIKSDLFSIFWAPELQILISGASSMSLKDLKAYTRYIGYTAFDRNITRLWTILEGQRPIS
jgi:HECT-domain (ubiquitin-transferase)